MALIYCPECGRENVSDNADSCPNCGYGIKRYFDAIRLEEQTIHKKQIEEQQKMLEIQKLNEERILNKKLEKETMQKRSLEKQKFLTDNHEQELEKLNKQWDQAIVKIIISVLSIFLLPGICVGIEYFLDIEFAFDFLLVLAFVLFIIGIALTVFAVDNFLKINNKYRIYKEDYQSYMGFKPLDEFETELKLWCDSNYVILKENSKFSEYVSVNNTYGYIWFSNKDIVFCPDQRKFKNIMDALQNIIYIKYEDIQYYTKDGSVSYTNQVVNTGNNISVSGAIVGGLIAGEAGAIIGSRKDMNQFKNITVEHDEVHTYVYYNNNGKIEVLDIEGNEVFQFIIKLMPEKEYYYLLSKQNSK